MPLEVNVLAVTFKNLTARDLGVKTNAAQDGSIGATIRAEIELETNGVDMAGMRLIFNPALFLPSGLSRTPLDPDVGYSCEIPSDAVLGDVIPMPLFTGTAYENANANTYCDCLCQGGNKATIRLTFLLTMDMAGLIEGAAVQNADRLLKTHPLNVAMTPGGQNSVYRNTNRGLFFRLRSQHESDPSDIHLLTHFEAYQARFYGYGLPNNTNLPPNGELVGNNYGYQIELWRGGVQVDDFSPFGETEVRLYLEDMIPFQEPWSTFRAFVIRTDAGDNLSTFQQQYGCEAYGSELEFGTTVDDEVLGGSVLGIADCYELLTYEGIASVRLRFKVDNDLDPFGTYAVVFVVSGWPNASTNSYTNSFIRTEIPANGLAAAPTLTEDEFDGTIIDYNIDAETDNVASTVVDHLKLKVRVNRAAYDALPEAVALGSTWNDGMRSVKLRIIDEATDAVLWQTDFFKVGAVWSSPAANPLTEGVDGDWNTYEVMLHTCYPNDAGLPDFSGKTIKVLWIFSIDFPALQWRVDYRYPQRIAVRGYTGFSEVIQSIQLFDYESGLPLTSLCQSDLVLVRVTLDPAKTLGLDWNIRVKWSLEPHGFDANALQRPAGTPEEESYVGQFPQLDQPEFTLLPAQFVDGVATFVFNHANVAEGEKPRLHVIAEPVAGDCPEPLIELAEVMPDCGNAQYTVNIVASSTDYFTVLGIAYSVDGGPSVTMEFGAGFYDIGPFGQDETVQVFVLRDGGSDCSYDLGEFSVECGPCDAEVPMPAMQTVNFVTTADQQAALEASSLTVGWKFLITDLPSAAPPGATLFEQNTGNIATWNGSGWNITNLLPGEVVNDLSAAAGPDYGKWWVIRGAANGTALYPSGKMALEWLYPARGQGFDPAGGHRAFSMSANTNVYADDNNLSECRRGTLQAYSPLDAMWVDLMNESEENLLTVGDTTHINVNTRIAWYGGPTGTDFQGYSRERFFP